MPDDPNVPVTMLRAGKAVAVPADQVDEALRQGFTLEDTSARLSRLDTERKQEEYGGISGGIAAGGAAVLRGATLGASDVLLSGLGEGDDFRNLREVNPGISAGGEILGAIGAAALSGGGSLAASTPAAAVTRLGASLARTAEGAGALAKVGRSVVGGAVEGGLYGLGTGVSELALSDDPLTVEHMASTLGSNILFGGAVGGVGAGLFKSAEVGLSNAKGALDKALATRAAASEIGADLAALDSKGLTAAHKAEIEAIETARVPQRQQLADDLAAFRAETKEKKLFLATKDADVKGIGEIKSMSKVSLDADRQLDRALNKGTAHLGENLRPVLGTLQQQENALTKIAKSEPELRAVFAADASGTRAAALDAIPGALEQNRALQGRIREMMAAPSSPRLGQIADAKELLASGAGRKAGLGERLLQGSAFGVGASAVGSIPFLGQLPGAAALGGAWAAKKVSDVFGKFGKAIGEQGARTSKALGHFMDVTGKIAPAAPVLATKVLGALRYAPSDEKPTKPAKGEKPKKQTLAAVYKARSDEIKTQTAYNPLGVPVMRPEARQRMAAQLAPIRAVQPLLADRMETLAARRMEFLAGKLPRRPDLGVLQTGPDHWQPSDMEMRTFARYAAAVEDPGGIEERLAAGTITPEDAEAMRTVYPERMAAITRQILEKLPMLRESLPYQRRLALSIFSGVPVDAAMHPRILAQLQASFANEDGSEGGTQAPKPQPAFGSIKKSAPEPTPSQSRAQG